MKTYLLPLVFATLFTSSVFADSEMKRKDIKTVEDVKEYRAIVINKMKDRLNSGDLTEERANLLERELQDLRANLYQLKNKLIGEGQTQETSLLSNKKEKWKDI